MILAALAAAACIALPPTGPNNTTSYTNRMPPMRYRGDATIVVTYHSPAQVNQDCQKRAPPLPCGYVYQACTLGDHSEMPNPCDQSFKGESYAKLACHEKAHTLDWGADHPD